MKDVAELIFIETENKNIYQDDEVEFVENVIRKESQPDLNIRKNKTVKLEIIDNGRYIFRK